MGLKEAAAAGEGGGGDCARMRDHPRHCTF
jgi:hypothetical protein